MEKRGVIEPGTTPPEDSTQKTATADQLKEHPLTRVSDAVVQELLDIEDDRFLEAMHPRDGD